MELTTLDIHRLETCEMAAWEDFFSAAGEEVSDRAGIHLVNSEHGLIGCVQSANVLALNRTLGLGVRCDADPDAAIAIIQEYDRHMVTRFFVPLAPCAAPKSIKHDLERFGLRHYNNWVRVHRTTETVPNVDSRLKVCRIREDQAGVFAEMVCRNFDWPATLEPWIAATVGRPHWYHYIAFDGVTAAATGAFFKRGHCAWLDFATTDEHYRGKGGQSLLLATRIREAADLGCDLITMETAEDKPGSPAPSFRNALRLGFSLAYLRPNYIWERIPAAG